MAHWMLRVSIFFFLVIKYFLVKVCAFFRHNAILQYSMKITFFCMHWGGKKFVWLPLFNSSTRWQGGLVNSHFCSQIEESKQGDVQGFMELHHISGTTITVTTQNLSFPGRHLMWKVITSSLRELAANFHPRIAFIWKSRFDVLHMVFGHVYPLFFWVQ